MTWNRHGHAAMWGVLAVLLGPGTLTMARQASPPVSTGIHGRVTNAADDAPIARARVLATAAQSSDAHVAITDADGQYVLTDLPPGPYTVSVTRTGFAPHTVGEGRETASPAVTVTASQSIAVDVALVPGRSISGRILDEDGSPFAGAIVEALVSRGQGGLDALVSVATSETDDRGQFRLFGLAPGQYYVSAADPAFRSVSTAKGVLRYSPTYYPGVPFADQAGAIAVGRGAAPAPIEFRLKIVPPATVSGRLVSGQGKPLINGAIVLSAQAGEGGPMVAPGDPTILPDGRFTFAHVVPGHYQIRARAQTTPGGPGEFAALAIEVQGLDVQDIEMLLRPGATIDGSVKAESQRGAKAPPLTTIRVRAPFSNGNRFGDALAGTVSAGGTFALHGVMNGAHQLVVDGLPPPWVVKSIDYRGADLTDRGIDVAEEQQLRGVRIVIADVSALVSGTVRNARQRPVANAGVLVFPTVPIFWVRTNRRMRFASTDPDGRFTIAGLPSGDYIAVASMWVDESDLGRPDRLRALQPEGVPFTLDADDAQATVTLTMAAVSAGTGAGRPGAGGR